LKKRPHGDEYDVAVIDHSASDSQVILSRRDYHLHVTSGALGLSGKRTSIGFQHWKVVFSDNEKRGRHAGRSWAG
jgi:hypothetical protein